MGLASEAEVVGTVDVTKIGLTVAVVLTTYNDSTFLREAISSVIAQKHPADEVIVVDDGSNVNPAPIVAEFPQVTLLRSAAGQWNYSSLGGSSAKATLHCLCL